MWRIISLFKSRCLRTPWPIRFPAGKMLNEIEQGTRHDGKVVWKLEHFLGNQLGDAPSPSKTTRSTAFSVYKICTDELKFKTYSQQNQKTKSLYFFLGALLGRSPWPSPAGRLVPVASAFGWGWHLGFGFGFGALARRCLLSSGFCLGKIGLAEGCSKRYYLGRYVGSTDQNSTVENGGLSKSFPASSYPQGKAPLLPLVSILS